MGACLSQICLFNGVSFLFIIPFSISKRPFGDRNSECNRSGKGIGTPSFFIKLLLSIDIGISSGP